MAKSTVRLKLSTSPAMMTKGRDLLVPVEPPATTTGITGTMQGDRPVIRPPRKATRSSSPTVVAPLRDASLGTGAPFGTVSLWRS